MFKKILDFIFWTFILWAIILMFCLGMGIYDGLQKIEQNEQQEKEYYKKRMKYHGINVAMCQRGKCYFYRDGRRCKL